MNVKNGIRKAFAGFLVAVLLLTAAPLSGVVDLDLSGVADWFLTTAKAAWEGYLKYKVENGEARITDCDTSISGELVIPSTLGGYKVTSIGYEAFYGCTGLTSVTISDSVTSIGSYAFANCAGLTSITIPDSVTSIGYDAFSGCTGLTSVTIGNSVTSIGGSAFYGCTGLTSVTIPNSVMSIGVGAFNGCTGLTSIIIPDSVTSIGEGAFGDTAYYNNSDNWKNGVLYIGNHLIIAEETISGAYEIKDGTKTIANSAFYDCTRLTSITIGNNVTSIGWSAFFECTGLISITIPDSVTSIGWYAFEGCTGLTSITIPDSVTNIGEYAFADCTGLTSITIPDSVTSIGYYALGYYYDYDSEMLEKIDNFTIYGYTGTAAETYATENEFEFALVCTHGEVSYKEVPAVAETCTEDGYTAGMYCEECERYISGHRLIKAHHTDDNKDCVCDVCGIEIFTATGSCGENAIFKLYANGNCVISGTGAIDMSEADFCFEDYHIKKVIVEEGITELGNGTFSYCEDLLEVVLPESITDLGNWTFAYCNSLEIINLPSLIKVIGDSVFYKCRFLREISIPDNVETIGENAFAGADFLETVKFGTGLKNIMYSAFHGCLHLDDVVFPEGLTDIGTTAFGECKNISKITLPSTLERLGDGAFKNCKNLTEIKIPKTVSEIGNKAVGYIYDRDEEDFVKDEDFTIIGYIGTAAENYANEYGFNFVAACSHEEAFCKNVPAVAETCTTNGFTAGVYCEKCETYISGHEEILAHHIDENNDLVCDVCKEEVPIKTGKCGEKAVYNLYTNGTVTINGSGSITNTEAFNEFSTSVKNVIINEGITRIENATFHGLENLTELSLPNGLNEIGAAFADCTSLYDISIPKSVKELNLPFSNTAYYNNKNNWHDNVLYIGDCLIGVESDFFAVTKSVPETYSVKPGTRVIGACAFSFHDELKNVVIPEGVEYINYYAFLSSGIENITIPKSVKEIGTCAVGYYLSKGETPIPNFTIYGYPNTAAETYATENGFIFVSLDDEHTHSFSEWTVTKEATCTEEGEETRSCSCGETQTRKIEKIDHVMFTVVEPSTCKVKGVSYDVCDMCNETFNYTVLPLASHTFSAWTVTKKATCETAGEKTRTCSVCGTSETEEISALEHSFKHVLKNATCKEEGFEKDVCENCGKEINAKVLPVTAHTFSAWTVTKEATVFESGERVRSCSVCGFEEKETIEKLKFEEVKDEKTDISVICPDGSYDGKVEIEVKETFDGESYHILNSERGKYKKSLFDITTFVDGKKAQPNGSVWVKIPLPESYNPEKTTVYHVTNEGKLEKIESRVEDGYVVFETNHFSYYAIVDEGSQINPSSNCSCACHKKGLAKFFFKIKLFFQKIFKKNKICKCGVWHY